MEYRMEHKPPFYIVGISRIVGATMEQNAQIIPQMWTDAAITGVIAGSCAKISSISDLSHGLLGDLRL